MRHDDIEIVPTIETVDEVDWERVDEIVRKNTFGEIPEGGPRIDVPSDVEEQCCAWVPRAER